MRARFVKPGFFKDADVARCHPLARILFLGLSCLADRDGRLRDKPAEIKADALPHDAVDIDVLLNELHNTSLITRYEMDGMRLIQVSKSAETFNRHARPHPEEKSEGYPAPVDAQISRENTAICALPSSLSSSKSLPPLPPKGGNVGAVEKSEPKTAPVVQPSEFLDAWNSVPQFIHARGLTGKRLRCFQARARDTDWQTSWRDALAKAQKTPFCAGKNDRGWRATVDWFLRPDTVTKILEGTYDFGAGKGPPPKPPEPEHVKRERIKREREQAERERRQSRTAPSITEQLAGRFQVPDDD